MTDTVGSLGLTIDTTTLVLFCVARDAMVWADFLSIIYLKQKTMITRQHTDRIFDYPPCSKHRLPFLQDSFFRQRMLPLDPVFCRITPTESWITSWAIVTSVVEPWQDQWTKAVSKTQNCPSWFILRPEFSKRDNPLHEENHADSFQRNNGSQWSPSVIYCFDPNFQLLYTETSCKFFFQENDGSLILCHLLFWREFSTRLHEENHADSFQRNDGSLILCNLLFRSKISKCDIHKKHHADSFSKKTTVHSSFVIYCFDYFTRNSVKKSSRFFLQASDGCWWPGSKGPGITLPWPRSSCSCSFSCSFSCLCLSPAPHAIYHYSACWSDSPQPLQIGWQPWHELQFCFVVGAISTWDGVLASQGSRRASSAVGRWSRPRAVSLIEDRVPVRTLEFDFGVGDGRVVCTKEGVAAEEHVGDDGQRRNDESGGACRKARGTRGRCFWELRGGDVGKGADEGGELLVGRVEAFCAV